MLLETVPWIRIEGSLCRLRSDSVNSGYIGAVTLDVVEVIMGAVFALGRGTKRRRDLLPCRIEQKLSYLGTPCVYLMDVLTSKLDTV